jgi:hypothetical protein
MRWDRRTEIITTQAASSALLLSSLIGVCITENKTALTHLTYWGIIAECAYFMASTLFLFSRGEVIHELLHIPITQLSWFIAGAMTSLSLQDDAMVIEAETTLDSTLVGIANFVLHYFPPIIFTHIMIISPETHTLSFIRKSPAWIKPFSFAIIPLFFTLIYANMYNPYDQYQGDFNSILLYVGGIIGMLIGGGFILSIKIKNVN